MPEPNRRRHPRVKSKQLASRIRAGSALHIGLAVENISLGGMFVRCNTPLPVGTVVTAELVRPGTSAPIPLTGHVVASVSMANASERGQTAGMGIRFDPPPPHVAPRLEGLVAAIDPGAVLKAQVERVATSGSMTEREVPAYRPGDPAMEATRLRGELEAARVELGNLKALAASKDKKIDDLKAELERLKARLTLLGGGWK